MVFLVIGASGNQGHAVVCQLLKRGEKVRVFTRNPSRVEELKELGCEVAIGDLTDPESIRNALQGVSGAFLVTTALEDGYVEKEVECGKTFVQIAEEEGLPHLVYSSVITADIAPHIPHFNSKWEIEQEIHASGLEWTVLRPTSYMDNFDTPQYRMTLEHGVLAYPMTKNAKLGLVAVRDIGKAAAVALINPEKFSGETLGLGAEVPVTEMAASIAKATGKAITYEQVPDQIAEQMMPPGYLEMFHWFEEADTDHTPGLEEKLGFKLCSFDQYLAYADWAKAMASK